MAIPMMRKQFPHLFDLYHVIADATRVTMSKIEQVSPNLSTDLATRAGSRGRFGDVRYVFSMFAAMRSGSLDLKAIMPKSLSTVVQMKERSESQTCHEQPLVLRRGKRKTTKHLQYIYQARPPNETSGKSADEL